MLLILRLKQAAICFLIALVLCSALYLYQNAKNCQKLCTEGKDDYEQETKDGPMTSLLNLTLDQRIERSALNDRVLRDATYQGSKRIVSSNLKSCALTDCAAYFKVDLSKLITNFSRAAEISSFPPIYVVTPTYKRPEQIPELVRLSQTLMHVPNVYWLVVEDAYRKNDHVTGILRKSGIPFEHMIAPMPSKFKYGDGAKPKGVSNRNRGIEWIRQNARHGVMYFADDDNTYDLELFEEIRYRKRASAWPVGLCTKFGVSSPIVKDGKLIGFYDGWIAGRKFPLDMAGFAVNVEFLLARPKAKMPFTPGYEEDGFLKSLAPLEPSELELKAANCSKILVWHTQTKSNSPATGVNKQKYGGTNIMKLRDLIV